MKPDLLRAGETDLDRQLRLTIQRMARTVDLPREAWARFEQKLSRMVEKPLTTSEVNS